MGVRDSIPEWMEKQVHPKVIFPTVEAPEDHKHFSQLLESLIVPVIGIALLCMDEIHSHRLRNPGNTDKQMVASMGSKWCEQILIIRSMLWLLE